MDFSLSITFIFVMKMADNIEYILKYALYDL